MCGIAGYAALANGAPADPRLIGPMLDRLAHRGPDDRGSFASPRVVIGNTRLSIVDIAGGHQPIANEDGSVVVVCNGEIYNAPELRRTLEAKGHRFASRSDTEVLVHLYEEEGEDFLRSLNGMFALALYDRSRDCLLLARDRFGVKPLVYMADSDRLVFASEIKGLRAHPAFDARLSPEGLAVFLGLFYIPDPWTAYRNVRTLAPGHVLLVKPERIEERTYFAFDPCRKSPVGVDEAVTRTAGLLRQSVRRQLMADVPVGVMLSGGLDSRSMLYLANEAQPGTESFTITFEEKQFDEGGQAGDWARLLRSPHHPYRFTEAMFCDEHLERQAQLDQPYGLWCNTASASMARHIRDSGFKVVLGGEGGDELFLGYPTLQAAAAARYYALLPQALRDHLIKPLAKALPAGSGPLPLSFKIKSFVDADARDLHRTFFGFKEVIRQREWPSLLTAEARSLVDGIDPFIAFEQHQPAVEGLNWIDALAYFDLKVFLPGCNLFGMDSAFMAHSVELRVPFLDNDLADFAMSLEPEVRFALSQTKPVLRRALGDLVGPMAGTRRERGRIRSYSKAGFEIPHNTWLGHDRFRRFVCDALSPKRLVAGGFFQPSAVRRVLDDQLSGRANNERMLQAIMSLNLFLERQ